MIIGVIPARGGSKTIRRKNLALLTGTTTLLEAAYNTLTHICDQITVATDDPEIAAIAHLIGAQTVIRPPVTDSETIDEYMSTWLPSPATIIMHQPTVVGVTPDQIRQALETTDPTTLGIPMTHLLWEAAGTQTQVRTNRQWHSLWPAQEIGIRIYPPNSVGPPIRCHLIDGQIIDIDTPADLIAARQLANRLTINMQVLADPLKGTGHIYRAVILANELPHHDVTITLRDHTPATESLLASLGWPNSPAPPNPSIVIFDTLGASAREVQEARLIGAVAVDIESPNPDPLCDLVVNAMYPTGHANEVTGSEWAVLKPEFLAVRPTHRLIPEPGKENILITFGGSDPAHLTEKVAKAIEAYYPRVLPPPVRAGSPTLSMAEHMAWADLVITSGGRTVHEAQASGVPCIVLAQNPRELTHQHLGYDSGVINLGLGRLVQPETIRATVAEALRPTTWRELWAAASGKVDGKGARRIIREIERIVDAD